MRAMVLISHRGEEQIFGRAGPMASYDIPIELPSGTVSHCSAESQQAVGHLLHREAPFTQNSAEVIFEKKIRLNLTWLLSSWLSQRRGRTPAGAV